VKTLEDLVELVDLTLSADFDRTAAEARLGSIKQWVGELACVDSSDPALYDSVIETLAGVCTGIQTRLTTPLEVPWDELKQAFGEHEESALTVDDWNCPAPCRFKRGPPEAPGKVFLYVVRDNSDIAKIQALIVRRPRPAPLPRGT